MRIGRRLWLLIIVAALSLSAIATFQVRAQDKTAEPDHDVVLTHIEFRPNRVQATQGQTIRFTNRDPFQHDVYMVRTANRNQVLVPTTTLDPGQTVTVTIEEDGLFTLYCTIHGGMSGKISTTGTFELTEEEKQAAAALKVLPPIVKTGEKLFWADAQCHRCHQMGEQGDGLRGPNLQDIGFRAAARAQQLGFDSGTAYIIQSLMEPSAHIVEGYSDDMPKVYHPPIDLDEQKLTAIITYLQSQGGEVDTWAIELDGQKLTGEPTLNPFRDGDVARGQALFQTLACGSCHTVGDNKAISTGPELTEIGSYRNWTWLAESMITPNAEIGANWRSGVVYLKADEDDPYAEEVMERGIIRENTDEKVVLLTGPDQFKTFTGDKVDHVEMDKNSLMPTNFAEVLTFQQMADLITYLESLRSPSSAAANE